jgi:hypothetical protein
MNVAGDALCRTRQLRVVSVWQDRALQLRSGCCSCIPDNPSVDVHLTDVKLLTGPTSQLSIAPDRAINTFKCMWTRFANTEYGSMLRCVAFALSGCAVYTQWTAFSED